MSVLSSCTVSSVIPDPSSSRTLASVPHSIGLRAPGTGENGANRPAMAWVAAMTLAGVHAVRPIRPPARQTRSSSAAARAWSGANMTPNVDSTTSNAPSGNGSAWASASRPAGVRKLAGGAGDAWRIRVGDYRVLYEIRDAELLVTVVKLAHRRRVYRGR
jgi:hypothetical protein